jgi:nitric oxide reductase subunit C
MREVFTTSMARNIYYGGSVFFILLFLALTFQTHRAWPELVQPQNITPAVVRGKHVWEENNCVGCHSLLGEGAYFAPELGNVIERRGEEFVKIWMGIQPTNAPGRRQMPQFNLSEQQLDDLVEFLKWTNQMDTAGWPPNIEG